MPFKLYVDSRFRQDIGSNSDTQFSIELPHPVNVSGKCFVDTILVPTTVFVIRSQENDQIYLRENSTHYRTCTIPEGQYNALTLKDAVVATLNGTGKNLTGEYIVAYDVALNKLQISLTLAETVEIFPVPYLKVTPNSLAAWGIAAGAARDSGPVTGFSGLSVLTATDVQTANALNAVNCQPYHQLFLRSTIGNGYDAIAPDGSGDVIRRITVQVPLNQICVDQHSLPYDSVTVGTNREINSLSFTLTDVFGRVVDTKGHHVSFSIIFLEDE